jgi:hypothetical protein
MSDYAFTKVANVMHTKGAMPSGSVSISKTGRIGLSREFVDEYDVTEGKRALLYWDEDRKALAFTFTSGERKPAAGAFAKIQATDGYNVAFVGNGSAGYIIATGFFKEIGINPAAQRDYYYQFEAREAADLGITDGGKTAFVVTLE